MSWNIAVVVNTLKIPLDCAEELCTIKEGELWSDPENVTNDDGLFEFPPDLFEGIDIINPDGEYKDVSKALLKYKVKGEICFADVEGNPDDARFWGYRFDGEGGMKELEGSIVWKENPQVFRGKTVVITGTLKTMLRHEAESAIERSGGKVGKSVTRKSSVLVVGSNPGSKVSKARDLGVQVMTEQEFIDLFQK